MPGPHACHVDRVETLEELLKLDIGRIEGDLDSLKKHARNLNKALAGKIPRAKANPDKECLIAYLKKYLPIGVSTQDIWIACSSF